MHADRDADVIQLLTALVSIPSPSGREARASRVLTDWMHERGFAARVDEAGNAIGVKGEGPREILLLGHIDTFPGDIAVRREGDLLYGRGTVDAKGPLCTFAAAAAGVTVPPGWRVTVVGAVEEEAATSRGARHILRQRIPPSGHAPAFCVIGEPSRWDRVTLGYRGRVVLDLRARLPQAHSAGSARLPAEAGVALWRAIESYCDAESGFDRLSAALNRIVTQSEGAYAVVDLAVGVRVPPARDPEVVESDLIRRLAAELFGEAARVTLEEASEPPEGPRCREYLVVGDAPRFEGAELRCVAQGGEPAYAGGKSNSLVRAFLAAIRAEGGAPRFVVKTGTSDMNVVGPFWPETPMVAYGPGDSALDHTPNEHVDLQEYLKAVGVLRATLGGLMTNG